ncbi:MAG: glycosyltransferase family 2 protein [Synechococcus sp.]
MKISIVIPVYNEAAHLTQFLARIDILSFSVDKELIFINDCSTDSSGDVLEGYTFKSKEVIVIHQPENLGKGSAIQLGFERATGDIIGVQDADFEYNPNEIEELVKPLVSQLADVVYGSRYKKSNMQVHRTYHYLVNRFLTMLSNLMSGLYLTDMETCYKFFKADLIQGIQLSSRRFGFEPEITAKIAKLNVRVFELPISYYPRNYSAGKKITWKDGVAALWHLINYNYFCPLESFIKPNLDKRYLPQSKQIL